MEASPVLPSRRRQGQSWQHCRGPARPSRDKRGAWGSTVTGNAELQISAFLKENAFEWHVLKLVWLGRGRQAYSYLVVLKGEGLNGRNLPLF